MQNQTETPKRTFPFSGVLLIALGLLLLIRQFVDVNNLSGGAVLVALGLFFIFWGALERVAGLLIRGTISLCR